MEEEIERLKKIIKDQDRALRCVWDVWTNGGDLNLAVLLVKGCINKNK